MRTVLLSFALAAVGCGPLQRPMVERLGDEQQQHVDHAWSNMLAPPDRLDRTLLLDVVLTHRYHQYGVDRLHMVSEKHVDDGLVVMEVLFDLERPDLDEFSLTYFDSDGVERRCERYTRDEVEGRSEFLFRLQLVPDAPGDSDALTAEQREQLDELRAERDVCFEEIRAATQPADSP